MSCHAGIITGALGAAAVTSLGVFVGWAMDQSLMPPIGGGWRCYAACIAAVWGFAAIVILPVLVSRFGKALVRHSAQR